MVKTANKQQAKRPRHTPLRTCIICRENKSKRELLRIVRTPDGHVLIDATGKKSGRGAYLCTKLSCWQKALKEKRLEREFGIPVPEEDRTELEAYMATLPPEEKPLAVATGAGLPGSSGISGAANAASSPTSRPAIKKSQTK